PPGGPRRRRPRRRGPAPRGRAARGSATGRGDGPGRACLSASQRGGHGQRDAPPLLRLRLELLPPGARELVVAGAAVVVGLAPGGAEPARLLHAVQGGEVRARLHHEGAARDLLYAAVDGQAVPLAPAERL